MSGYHDISASEEHCSLCGAQASHKVAEDAPDTRTSFWRRHPFTNYLCCGCFGRVMGSLAVEWCARSGVPGGGEPQPTTSTDPKCTGLMARWCPVHGDCTCEPIEGVRDEGPGDDDDCPLLSPESPHPSAGGGDQPDTPCPHENTAWTIGGPEDGEGYVMCTDCGQALHPDQPDTPCDDCNGAGGWWEGQPGARIYVPCHACAPTDSSGHGE